MGAALSAGRLWELGEVERTNESTYSQIKREHGITYQDMKAEARGERDHSRQRRRNTRARTARGHVRLSRQPDDWLAPNLQMRQHWLE